MRVHKSLILFLTFAPVVPTILRLLRKPQLGKPVQSYVPNERRLSRRSRRLSFGLRVVQPAEISRAPGDGAAVLLAVAPGHLRAGPAQSAALGDMKSCQPMQALLWGHPWKDFAHLPLFSVFGAALSAVPHLQSALSVE